MEKDKKNEFSLTLFRLMHSRGLKQKDLAEKLGFSQGSVSGWLKGQIPNSAKLAAIAEFFCVSTDELLRGYDPLDHLAAAAAMADKHPGTHAEKQAKFDRVMESQRACVSNWRERAELAERKNMILEKRLEKVHKGLVKLVEQMGEAE
jgi:transcriptional regulator with XRE-family HTH domain